MDEGAAAGMALLQVESLRVRFPKLLALDDVIFTLRGGELLGLIGPNGAGKTTLLRSIAGLQMATRGWVKVLDQFVVPGELQVLRNIGFTPDTPGIYEDLTVRQFLTFVGKGYGLSRGEAQERIDFWLDKVWLTEKANQKLKGLSRGMRQRVGIARTLLPNPPLVLLDEPAAGLDPVGRVQFRQLLINLREQGKALIVSSHILSDLQEYCTHVGIMSAGRMVQFGTVRQVADSEKHPRCRYRLTLAAKAEALGNTLATIADVSAIEANGDTASLEFDSDKSAAARLLSQLIAAGLPVSSFVSEGTGLEGAYLRTGIRQVD